MEIFIFLAVFLWVATAFVLGSEMRKYKRKFNEKDKLLNEKTSQIENLEKSVETHKQLAFIKSANAKELTDENYTLKKTLDEEQEKYCKLMNQKKSSEVRLGQIGEHIAPFLDEYPWDSTKFRFIGHPIDGVQFNDDEVIFVEIKTGKSGLSKNQRMIRDLIKEGKVGWAVFRVGDKECKLKKEPKDV